MPSRSGSRRTPLTPRPSGQPSAALPAPATRLESAAAIFAACGLALLIASLTIFKMSNNDIWIHLKTGENILKTFSVPDKDPYSFTAADHDYVAHEWLSGVLFHLVFAAGGVNALIFFKSLVIFVACAALHVACRALRIPLEVQLPCFAGMLFIASARFLERPHIFSFLFEAIYLMCYFAWRQGGRRAGWLIAIPILHVFWTNLHGGHFQGVFLLVMLAMAEVVMHLRGRWLGLAAAEASSGRDVLLVCLLPVACLLTALLNPYGIRLLTFPFELTGQDVFMRGIYEWQSALYPSYNLSSMYLYYIGWTAALFGSFLLVRGHGELRGGLKDSAVALNLLLGALWIFYVHQFASVYRSTAIPSLMERRAAVWYGVVGLFLIANLHRLEFHHAGIAALFYAMSLRHNRAVADCAVATLPSLAHNLHSAGARLLGRRAQAARPAERAGVLAALGVILFGLGAWTFTHSYHFGFHPPTLRETGLGVASNMPTGAVDYIERNRITGHAFPSYNAAAMLLHRMWPDVRVSMDSRNDVYGEALYREYIAALSGGAALQSYLARWPIDFFLITYGGERNSDFFRFLDQSPDWALVYFDDRAVVYVRNLPRFEEIIRRDRYRLIQPAVAGTVEIRVQEAEQWLAEAQRAEVDAPHAWTPLQYKIKALMAMNRLPEALAASRKLLELFPGAFFVWADVGTIHIMSNEPDLAREAFRRCLDLRPDFPPCLESAERLRSRPAAPPGPGGSP